MTIAILVVLNRIIVESSFPDIMPYIDQETVVERFQGSFSLDVALGIVEQKYPKALSFEIYRPRTDHMTLRRV